MTSLSSEFDSHQLLAVSQVTQLDAKQVMASAVSMRCWQVLYKEAVHHYCHIMALHDQPVHSGQLGLLLLTGAIGPFEALGIGVHKQTSEPSIPASSACIFRNPIGTWSRKT